MNANCLACLVGVPYIGTPAGKADDPIGVCVSCGSLVCGQHGHRDPKPAFVCIQCDVALQAGSAGWWAWRRLGAAGPGPQVPGAAPDPGDDRDADAQIAADALAALLPAGWGALVTSFEEWAERRPSYSRLIDLIQLDLDRVVRHLDQTTEDIHGQEGMGVRRRSRAGYEAAPRFDAFAEEALASLWVRLNRDERRLIAAALVLALVMNLPASSLPPVIRAIGDFGGIRFREQFPPPGQTIPFEDTRYR